MKKLERIIKSQEQLESQTFTEAEWWAEWARVREQRLTLIDKARFFSRMRLADALDAAGQVYVFGTGPFRRFDHAPAIRDHLEFERFEDVLDLWTCRVQPEQYKAAQAKKRQEEEEEEKQDRGIDDVVEYHPNQPEEATDGVKVASSIDNPFFAHLHVCTNTASLWGRGVSQVSIGGSIAYALTDLGDLYCWGGNVLNAQGRNREKGQRKNNM